MSKIAKKNLHFVGQKRGGVNNKNLGSLQS